MTTIKHALAGWGLVHRQVTPTERRIAAEKILRDGCSVGGQPTTAIERRALESLLAGSSIDDNCPPDLADPVAVLRAVIDAGDDSALTALADALEETGDARAAGVRLIDGQKPDELYDESGWVWLSQPGCPTGLSQRVFGGLVEDEEERRNDQERIYPTRSAAFLALAEALTESEQ